MDCDEFINWLAPVAQEICKSYGLFPSVLIAQGALESGWGKYIIGNYNLFGRKWNGEGNYIEKETQEWDGSQYITITAKFQDYDTLDEAVEDWCILLTQEPCYQEVNNHLDSVEDFVRTLAPIYATDPNYANGILNTINACDLTQYDN